MNEKRRRICVCVRVHMSTRASLNEVFDASVASRSEAFGAIAGAEMDAANFSISECVKEREKLGGGKTKCRGHREVGWEIVNGWVMLNTHKAA